jgi:hypothetical protein
VDALYQMARLYSVKGDARRWPVAVFYNLLDMAAINMYMLYKQCLDKTVSRRDSMMDLVCELYENHMNITKHHSSHSGERRQNVRRTGAHETSPMKTVCSATDFFVGACSHKATKLCAHCGREAIDSSVKAQV